VTEATIHAWPTHRRQAQMLAELVKNVAGSFSPPSPMRKDWITLLQVIQNFVDADPVFARRFDAEFRRLRREP
jgi:hypothetical protein